MSDSAKPFAALEIEISPGRFRTLHSVRDAGEYLVVSWPEEGRGPAYRSALRTCLAALEGKATTAAARSAFLEAAREGGIFVRG